MPEEVKKICACNSDNLGYTSFQDETLAPDIQSSGDTKEGYYIGTEIEDGLAYKNVWPNPSLIPEWRETMIKYHTECIALARRTIAALSSALKLPLDYFDPYFAEPTALLRLLKYGSIVSTPESGLYGAGPHSDYGMITLLATNEVTGLQILHGGEWISVCPRPDCFIVNLGDCLQMMTNNRFKSTVHRVLIGPHEAARYSMAFFFEPNRQALVKCLPEFLAPGDDPLYEPILYGDYLLQKYERTHADFKVSTS